MFGALQCPSSGARRTAVAASGFRMNVEVEVFSAVVGLLVQYSTVQYRTVQYSTVQYSTNMCFNQGGADR